MSKQTKKVDPQPINPPEGLGGESACGEVPGCPTGLADQEQATVAQQPGGGGAPGTGVNPSVPPSTEEAVTEDQIERSNFDDTEQ